MKSDYELRKIRKQIFNIEADLVPHKSASRSYRYYKFWWYTAILRADRSAVLLLNKIKPYNRKEMTLPRFEALSRIVTNSSISKELLGKVSYFSKISLEVVSGAHLQSYLNWGDYNFNLALIWPMLAMQPESEVNLSLYRPENYPVAILRIDPPNKNWIILLASIDPAEQVSSKLVTVEIIS